MSPQNSGRRQCRSRRALLSTVAALANEGSEIRRYSQYHEREHEKEKWEVQEIVHLVVLPDKSRHFDRKKRIIFGSLC